MNNRGLLFEPHYIVVDIIDIASCNPS